MKLFQVLVVSSQANDAVGAGLPLVTVKLSVPSLKESAYAIGAARHKAKTTAPRVLNRLGMEVLN